MFQVVKHGNLTNAAKALGISQPALSQGLNSLEKEIGFKIFNRRANPITLTAEGDMYLQHIKRLAILNENFDKQLDNYRNTINNKVVIGAPGVYVQSLIGPSIQAIDHIEYKVHIKTASVDNLIQAAEEGSVDCFISTKEDLPDNFEKEFICQEEIVFCVPATSSIQTLDYDSLQNVCLICLEEQFPLQQAVDTLLDDMGIEKVKSIVVDQVASAVELVEQGIGVCFASKEATINRNVKTIQTNLLGRKIYIAYDKELYRTKACEDLIEAIINQ